MVRYATPLNAARLPEFISFKDKYVISPSPVADFKGVKNETELEGFRHCHIRDGVALARYFAWLEEQLEKGVEMNECQVAEKLEQFRSYV